MENGFAWLLVIAVALVGLFLWQRQLAAALITGVALYAGLAHTRYMALFAISVVVLGGPFLSELFTCSPKLGLERRARVPVYVPMPVALCVTMIFCGLATLHIADFVSSRTYVVFNSDWRFGAGESSWFPAKAADFILREHLPGNVFEEYALGGYAAWRLGPYYLDFLDGRSDRLNPELVVEQRRLYNENPDSEHWRNVADRWNLNTLIMATSGFRSLQKLDPLVFCQSEQWRPVYMDDVSLVFIRNTAQNHPWIDRLQIDCRTVPLIPSRGASRSAEYDFYLDSGALLFALHRDQEAEAMLQRAAALYPEDPNAPLLLGYLFERQGRLPEAEAQYLASMRRDESSGTLYALGRLYAKQRRPTEAVLAMEKAAEYSVDPLEMYMSLAQFQLILHHPEQALVAFDKAAKSSPYRDGGESLAPELYAKIAEGRSEANRLLGRWVEAISFQKEATERTPQVANRWERLAFLYQATGQPQLATEARQQAMRLESSQLPH